MHAAGIGFKYSIRRIGAQITHPPFARIVQGLSKKIVSASPRRFHCTCPAELSVPLASVLTLVALVVVDIVSVYSRL